ncbi:RNA polymerase sigma factor [Paenibacillus sp. FSL L8-0493]|uniref:RNA polymerase sigma factor n=1 Tax=Paenibacillus TaxID=44249 RepID=UPI00096C0283|nr:RNA polymerase sigma factor [Paenibacillus odorifer]OMD15478.1 RNA polymerase subunit sigma [Paenibacillus odorifer]OME59113.1 RNA polymerase subunit sigma [Paenibacillus odorifer]
MDEVRMVDFARMDEEVFFKRLYVEHRKMYTVAYSYLRTEADALEVVQEASCRAWMKRKKLKDEQSFTPWLIRITINCCMDELRRKKRVIPTEKLAEVATQEMKSNDRIDLERAMNRLKPKYRHVVLLKYYNDMTTIEIAKVLEKPEGTIKTWLREGLKQLRNVLK